ncbi:MAG: sensor histidine kinase [bacterium]
MNSDRQRLRVLAAENDPVFREFLSVWLESKDVDAVVTRDGLEALHELRRRPFDVLLTDLVMPNVDGSTLCSMVRDHPEWSGMYIAVVSATAAEDDELTSRVAADVFIAKRPLQDMKHDLERILGSLQNGERPARQVLGVEHLHQRRITKELLEQSRNWDRVYARLSEGLVVLTPNNYVVAMNPAAEKLLGVTGSEALAYRFEEVMPNLPVPEGGTRRQRLGGYWVELSTAGDIRDRQSIWTLIVRDVSLEEEKARTLRNNLNDRELMLREIHHRLKNNLLMVASYVSLQIDDETTGRQRQILQTIRANLESIALAHDRLYREESLAEISFGEYLRDVVHAAVDMYGRSITAHVELEDAACSMEANRALRLGLVVNELVMNALQHAFPEGGGTIRVDLHHIAGRRARLTIHDNGVGMPGGKGTGAAGTAARRPNGEAQAAGTRAGDEGFGITIIRAMVDQIGGTVTFESPGRTAGVPSGTTVTIEFDCS